MNAEPSIQAKLLDLAAVDAELTRIEHRRKVLPEAQEVARLEGERTTRKDAAVKVEIKMDDLDRDIRKLEGEIEAVRKREERDRGMLTAYWSGPSSSPNSSMSWAAWNAAARCSRTTCSR